MAATEVVKLFLPIDFPPELLLFVALTLIAIAIGIGLWIDYRLSISDKLNRRSQIQQSAKVKNHNTSSDRQQFEAGLFPA